MNRKASLELSMNTLVVVIISLVILSGGITLLYKFISGAEDTKTQLDERTQQALENMIVDQGKQVALPFHTAIVERGEVHVFGIGVLNIYPASDARGSPFTIEITPVKLLSETGEETEGFDDTAKANALRWIEYDSGEFFLQENQHTKQIIVAAPDENTKIGQYIFTVRVKHEGSSYGTVQKMYVTVS